jgi:hypothetical protein
MESFEMYTRSTIVMKSVISHGFFTLHDGAQVSRSFGDFRLELIHLQEHLGPADNCDAAI